MHFYLAEGNNSESESNKSRSIEMKSEDDDFSDGEFNISDEYTKKEEVKMVKNK